MVIVEIFLFLTTIVIPKAGTKIAGFPVYLSLVSTAYFCIKGFRLSLFFSNSKILVLSSFFLLFSFLFSYFLQGAQTIPAESLGYFISFFSFLSFYAAKQSRISTALLFRLLFWSVIVLGFYGYLQKIIGDYAVVLPGITANFSEARTEGFLAEKNNMIWGLDYLKLTSTYQNGNLFGLNYLIIVGVFLFLAKLFDEKNKAFFVIIFCTPIFLMTASATVYLGFFVLIGFYFFSFLFNIKGVVLILIIIFTLLFFVLYSFYEKNIFYTLFMERLINRDYMASGGRTDKLFHYVELVKNNPLLIFTGMISSGNFYRFNESFPFSVLEILGIFYLFFQCFLVFWFLKSVSIKSLRLPFLAYLIAAMVDGAFWSPPTALNFYLLLGFCASIKFDYVKRNRILLYK